MADDVTPGSPMWWLLRLHGQLRARTRATDIYDEYYSGKHRLAFASQRFKTIFGELFREFADDWCELVVDAVEERLNVVGFRFGEDPKADKEANRFWQVNRLDAESQLGHIEALVRGNAAVIVWANPDDDKTPLITVEDPTQVIVATSPGTRRRLAALKAWTDDDGKQMATLYLPDGLYKFQTNSAGAGAAWGGGRWRRREVRGEEWPLPNPLGVVPVIPLENRPRLRHPGRSEIAKVIPVQDAVNKLILDMMVAAEFSAFRQRWATGFEIPDDTTQAQYKAAMETVWTAEDKDTKFGEFSETSLENYVKATGMLVQHIASQTRTPPHYFYLSGQFPSGESIKSAETGLVAKAVRKQRHFGETWEEVIRLGFRVIEDPRADVVDAETIWADPESRTEGEHIDAVLKRKALGVPEQQLLEDAGYTPPQIARFAEMRKAQPAEPPVDDDGEQDPPAA